MIKKGQIGGIVIFKPEITEEQARALLNLLQQGYIEQYGCGPAKGDHDFPTLNLEI